MPVRDIIVIGAGAGGVEAIEKVLHGLSEDLKGSVFIVQHLPGHSPSELVRLLNRSTNLPVTHPENGQHIESGLVYLAPPNRHLLLRDDTIILGNGPKENRARPAVDALFRTAAHAYGERVAGVILSGALNDGTAGLMSVKRHGGICIVQDPEDAIFDGMPRSAMAFTDVDYVLNADDIAVTLSKLIESSFNEHKQGGIESMSADRDTPDTAEIGGPGLSHGAPSYPPSALTCPACGGAVWQVQDEALTMFKCHVGHSYTAELMLEEQSEAVDAAAWVLLRSLEENIFLRKQLASWARLTERTKEADFHEQQAANAEKQADALRKMVVGHEMGGD